MKLVTVLTVVILVGLLFGTAWADDPITDIQVYYSVDTSPTIHLHTVGGTVKQTMSVGDTSIMITRDVATTIPWSMQTTTDGTFTYNDFLMPWAWDASGGTKTCCSSQCDNGTFYGLNTELGDCTAGGFGCEHCVVTCSGGWVNCPAGTKLAKPLD
jgi:hypothetical protein